MLFSTTKRYCTILAILLLSNLNTQDCNEPTISNGTYLNGNNVRALFPASGNQFWDGEFDSYLVTVDSQEYTTIFNQALWIGGLSPTGEQLIAAGSYNLGSYLPGPLNEDATPASGNCANYDRSWDVFRYHIEAHQADFADNGQIDNPILQVVGWPGFGNPEFADIHGFPLPVTPQGLAPFWDLNADGIYQPLEGEYPVEPRHASIPEHMVWTAFNTLGGSPNNDPSIIAPTAEIQCTAWSFNCTDGSDLLNNSIFTSFKIINRGVEPLEATRIGMWNDFDLGCYTDDFIGSAPAQNTYYVYNRDSFDNVFCDFSTGFGNNPPVQAVTFLNRELDGFIYTVNSSVGNPNPNTTDPNTAADFLNYLNARFLDGSSINQGGNGYDPSGGIPVNHVFNGDPNFPDTWSAYTENLGIFDWRGIGSTDVGTWQPGAVIELDLGYSLHLATDADHLGNITAMYNGVAELQDIYDNGWDTGGCQAVPICADDCVWTGDMNADGIANHVDLIAMSFGLGNTGPARQGPYIWAPRNGDSWLADQVLGPDNKHLDANGNGVCEESDFDRTLQFYNFTRPGYEVENTYPEGEEIYVTRNIGSTDFSNLEPGEFIPIRIKLETSYTNLRAVAFTMEYDQQYFETFDPISTASSPTNRQFAIEAIDGEFDCAIYSSDPQIPANEDFNMFRFLIRVATDFPPDIPSDETNIRFRNIRGFLADGTEVSLGATETVLQIQGLLSHTAEPAWAAGISIAPNPVKHALRLNLNGVTVDQLEIFDATGRLQLISTTLSPELDVSQLPIGTYFLRLTVGNTAITRKVIKL